MKTKTKEPQYSDLLRVEKKYGRSTFGIMSNQVWNQDPKRIGFVLARYKFVSKMLNKQQKAFEVGCADGFGSRIVCENVKSLDIYDFDSFFLKDAKITNKNSIWRMKTYKHDFVKEGALKKKYDAVYALDVLEHINKKREKIFINNINNSLKKKCVAIYGMPSIESQKYASKQSKIGHINCKSGDELKFFLNKFYEQVFIFSMNDEVVHTGFYPMSHYLIALCCIKKV